MSYLAKRSKNEIAKNTVAILATLSCLTSCGGGTSSPTSNPSATPDLSGVGSTSSLNNTTATGTTSVSFGLVAFSPDSSASSIPTQVTVSFNKALAQSASSGGNWTYTCSGGSTGTITNVSVSGQTAVLTLTPVVASTSTSTVCTLQALSSIASSTGETLPAPASVSYITGSSTSSTTSTTTASFMGYIKDINSSTMMMGTNSISINVFPTDGNGTLPASLQLVLDSVPIYRAAYVANPFVMSSFDTTQFPNGSHVLHVNAYDAKGNKVASDIATPVTFTIQNMSTELANACKTNKGYGTMAKNTAICVVPLSKCPIGMKAFDDGFWTTTKPVDCYGGSTTGCGSGPMKTTDFHATFGHLATETVTVSTLAACGPAMDGSRSCSATITSIGCVIAN